MPGNKKARRFSRRKTAGRSMARYHLISHPKARTLFRNGEGRCRLPSQGHSAAPLGGDFLRFPPQPFHRSAALWGSGGRVLLRFTAFLLSRLFYRRGRGFVKGKGGKSGFGKENGAPQAAVRKTGLTKQIIRQLPDKGCRQKGHLPLIQIPLCFLPLRII